MDNHSQSAAVRARGIVKSFGTGDTQVTVLKGIDLDIYLGELLLLVGESGGGKTTLLSAIAGMTVAAVAPDPITTIFLPV